MKSACRFCAIGFLLFAVGSAALSQPGTPANSVVGFPGAGVIQAGDVWESFLPQGTTPDYSEAVTASVLGVRRFLRMGNFDRNWTTPGTHYPAAFPMTPYWVKDAIVLVYDPDTTWNRGPASTNPSFYMASAGPSLNYSNFAQLTYRSTLNGAGDQSRHYTIEPYFVDGALRQHAVYEAAWPTNLGIDVTMRAHGFAAPNWDNLNDYVIVEIQLKNIGFLDMNMDGAADGGITNHDIKALALQVEEEAYMSISSYGCGARCVNDLVPTIYARQAAWVGDPDSTGSPWAFSMVFPSATTLDPVAGGFDFGFNGGISKNYLDLKHGWVMIDVKSGGLPADRSQSTSALPSKQTIFGTHPIGTGSQRGWYLSGGSSSFAGALTDPRKMFYITTGVWYANGGQLSHSTDFTSLNLSPDPNFFASGNTGDPLSFIPKLSGAGRPVGDFKSTNHFDQVSFEDGSADSVTVYPAGWGKWTLGCSNTENFDADMFTGVGPFSLRKDSTMTIVFATMAGYRLEGIQRSVRAARWCYESNFQIPRPPSLPDLLVTPHSGLSVAVDWDNRAEGDAQFAGYKIWGATKNDTIGYLNEGMRIIDRYQEQMTPGARPASVFKPVNPKFDARPAMLANATHGTYQPDTWGSWRLMKVISKAALGSLPVSTLQGYNYVWTDSAVAPGSTNWYYVSAYKEGTYTGPGGDVTGRIETHYTNRNGASGLWVKTFPFATANANFPSDASGLKAIGASVILGPASVDDRQDGLPARYELSQNYPNPFNPVTVIGYALPRASRVNLSVFNVLGERVATLVDGLQQAGNQEVRFDGSALASGVYFYRLIAGDFSGTKKLALVR